MTWSGEYYAPGVSVGAKVGLGLSVVVVLGAIAAGLLLRRRRAKAAVALKRQASLDRLENTNSGRRRRVKRSQSSRSGGDILPQHHHHQHDSSEPPSPVSLHLPLNNDIPLEPVADHERTLRGGAEWPLPSGPGDHTSSSPPPGVDKTRSHSTRSTNGSTSSTIVEPTSPRFESMQQQQAGVAVIDAEQLAVATTMPPTILS